MVIEYERGGGGEPGIHADESSWIEGYGAPLITEDIDCPNCGYNLRGLTSDRCPRDNEAQLTSASSRTQVSA